MAIFNGTAGPDTLVGSAGADTLNGLDGDDVIDGAGGNDTIHGGPGDDTLLAGPGNDYYEGDEGTDTLTFAASPGPVVVTKPVSQFINGTAQDGFGGTDGFYVGTADELIGSAFNDSLTGSPIYINNFNNEVFGDDWMQGGPGNDTLRGLAGNDELQGDAGDDLIDGGPDNDLAMYINAPGPVTASLATGIATGDGTDTLVNIEGLLGSAFNDTLQGSAQDNALAGFTGNNVLDGGGGNDIVLYVWAPSAVVVDLTAGTASGSFGADTLQNIESVLGSRYDDQLKGDAGDNWLHGEDGNDTLDGMGGNDLLIGGLGQDTAVFSGNFADSVIRLGEAEGQFVVTGPDGVDNLLEIELLEFEDGVFSITGGTAQSDVLTGTGQTDILRGRGGNDHLSGEGGDDALFGDEGNDTLDGDAGNDLLDGGTGADTMTGGSGNDTYVVDDAADSVIETDALAALPHGPLPQVGIGGGIDKVISSINYTLGGFVENLDLAAGTQGLSGTGNSLANVLRGNAGNNRLMGAAGNDTLDGGDGIDTAVFTGTRAGSTTAHVQNGLTVSGPDGADTLSNIERLDFSDVNVAFDLDGNAGKVAKILGAVFGPAFVSNASFVGIGLQIADSGMAYASMMQLALDLRLGAGASSTAVVNLLYTNVIGTAPNEAQRAEFVAYIDSGAFTAASLGVLAADSGFNTAHIGLAGLAASGIDYV